MNYGLLGYPLSHTMSPFIHKKLFEAEGIKADYKLFQMDKLCQENIDTLKKLDGFNITIPYKGAIIEFLDFLDSGAEEYKSVNTVKMGKGYNTDVDGYIKSVEKLGSSLLGRVLILGSGGVARMAVMETAKKGGKLVIAVRKSSIHKAEELKQQAQQTYARCDICVMDINNIEGEFDLLINCTPVGMYPNTGESPVTEDVLKRCKAVFDMIYNPTDTRLLQLAAKNRIKYIGGMYMLVKQAAKAHEIWNNTVIEESVVEKIEKQANIYMNINFQKRPLAFIGFMASGKTTTAKAFAKSVNMDFVDIDEEITKREKLSIPEIFTQKGEAYFREMETKLLSEYANKKSYIISAGGGAPMFNQNKDILQKNTIVVYIDTPFELCHKRITEEKGRPIASGRDAQSLKELYEHRSKVYSSIADIIIDGTKELEEKIEEIKNWIE